MTVLENPKNTKVRLPISIDRKTNETTEENRVLRKGRGRKKRMDDDRIHRGDMNMASKEVLEKNEGWNKSQGRLGRVDAEERQRIAKMGGQALKLRYERKRLLKDLMLDGLELIDDETGLQNAIVLTMAQIERGKQAGAEGNKAYEVIRDTIGQKPSENVSMQVEMPEFVNDLKE